MPLHSLELTLDGASDAWVRQEWQALAAAGVPSQAGRRSASNAPHITVASGPEITPEAEATAIRSLGALLPFEMDLAGVVFLGRGPYAFARLLAPSRAVLRAVETVRAHVDDPHSPGWLAHVTLARRLRVDQVGLALANVATGPHVPRTVTVAGLRRWDPDQRRLHHLAGTQITPTRSEDDPHA